MWQEFSKDNPHRIPQWRWERAGLLAEGQLALSRRRDDKWVKRAGQFRAALNRCLDPQSQYVLSEKFPDLFWAWQLWDARDDEERRLLTHEVEARWLAGDTPSRIADRAAMREDSVLAYEALFFNVKERLRSRSYVLHQVLGRAVQEGIRERAYDLIWKLFGYKYGPFALDYIVEILADLPRPENAAEVQALLKDVMKTQLARKATIVTITMDASNSFTQTEILGAYLKLMELETQRDGGRGSQATILMNVEAMLGAIPFSVGDKPAGRANGVPALEAADRFAAEPRGDELMLIAAGIRPDGADQVETLEFPALPPPGAAPAEAPA